MYIDSISSSEDLGDTASGDDEDEDAADAAADSRPSLFNWQRGMTSSLSHQRLGQVGQVRRYNRFCTQLL